MAEWISVKDRLPEVVKLDSVGNGWTNMVLACDGKELYCGEFIRYARYNQIDFYGMEVGEIDAYGSTLKVTHWMPLPEPPKGE